MDAVDKFDPIQWLTMDTNVGSYDIDAIQATMWFMLIWNRFELKVCDREASLPAIDKSIEVALNLDLLCWEDFETFWSRLKAYLAKEGALNNLEFFLISDKRPNKREKARVKDLVPILQDGKPSIGLALEGMLFIAYRIRNNLFHGEKCVTNLSQQRELFCILNSLLAQYIDISTKSHR